MNAPGQPQFQPHFPGPSQMHPGQQNAGQARQGPGQQSFQNGSQQQKPSFDPRLQQWTLKKGKKPSWAEVEARQQHVSYDSLAGELETMLETIRKEKTSVQQLLNEIPSDNAHGKVSDLLKAQNNELFKLNPKLIWNIAAIRLAWTVIQHTFTPDERRLKRIDLVLKTEQRAPMLGAGAKGGAANGMQPNQKLQGQGGGQNPKNTQNQAFNNGQDPMFMQGHGREQGMNPGGPPPPPPPPPPPGQGGGPGMPLPPPPGGGQLHQQPGFQHPGMVNSGMFQENAGFPSMRHEPQRFNGPEILNPRVLKKQKSKSKIVPGQYDSVSDSGTDSSTDSDSSSSDPLSIISMDEPGYNTAGGRGRKSSHKKSKSKRHHQRRDSMHMDPLKSQKQKSSSYEKANLFARPPMGKHSGHKSNDHTPRSSHDSINPPVVQVHVHNGTTAQNEHSHDRENDRDRHGRRDSYRSQREPALVPNGPRDSFSRFDKFPGSVPMSRNSSTSTSRDSRTDGEEIASSASYDANSQFSPPPSPPLRGGDRHHRDRFDQSYHDDRHRSKRDHNDDYPHRERSHHHRRSYIPTLHMDHDIDGAYYRDEPSVMNLAHRPGLRRNSTQVHPSYPREHPRYPSRSMSYSEEPSYPPYYPKPKALQDSQAHYDNEVSNVESIVAATVSATLQHQKALDAVEHMHRSQRPLLDRRHSRREDYDPWASGQPEYSSANPMSGIGRRGPVYSGFRHGDMD